MQFKNITFRCDCNAEAAVFTKYVYDDGDVSYGLSFEDSYCGNKFNGLIGRFRRAWHAFTHKPVVHMDVFTDDKEKMRKFLADSISLLIEDDDNEIEEVFEDCNEELLLKGPYGEDN